MDRIPRVSTEPVPLRAVLSARDPRVQSRRAEKASRTMVRSAAEDPTAANYYPTPTGTVVEAGPLFHVAHIPAESGECSSEFANSGLRLRQTRLGDAAAC